jgi:hypothetical protein
MHGLADWLAGAYTGESGGPVRFWIDAHGREELLAGAIVDSRDSLGRGFPLLLAGWGRLPGWRERWDMLPASLESLWSAIETDAPQDAAALPERLHSPTLAVGPGPDPAQDAGLRALRALVTRGLAVVDLAGERPEGICAGLRTTAEDRIRPAGLFWNPDAERMALWTGTLGRSHFAAVWNREAEGNDGLC